MGFKWHGLRGREESSDPHALLTVVLCLALEIGSPFLLPCLCGGISHLTTYLFEGTRRVWMSLRKFGQLKTQKAEQGSMVQST